MTRALTDPHRVELLDGKPLLLVDGAVPCTTTRRRTGINWNASGRLDDYRLLTASFGVARTVRAVAPVAGHRDERSCRRAARRLSVRAGDGGTVGLDTPVATGFYRNGGLQVQHLGAELDHAAAPGPGRALGASR
ncbi:hypothetical protein [Streptomyces sp. KL116D]|uniref:hypothetical protein n=1 Tax=Streptomyces sp. KL116D TaxID=3045152 RepID=UPI00355890A7